MIVHPPRHLVWSTDTIDLSDPFQKRWLLRQILTHGRHGTYDHHLRPTQHDKELRRDMTSAEKTAKPV